MKIICIGRNYAAHATELGNNVPDEPLFFLKPETALLGEAENFTPPSYSADVHYELELVVRIGTTGKNIPESDALNHVEAFSIGLDMTARDVQSQLKAKGKPWEKAKAFDGSAIVSTRFLNWSLFNLATTRFTLHKNDELVQEGDPNLMLFTIPQLIAHISVGMTLQSGDLLFTGTPAGVGPVNRGDRLVGAINGDTLIDVAVE